MRYVERVNGGLRIGPLVIASWKWVQASRLNAYQLGRDAERERL